MYSGFFSVFNFKPLSQNWYAVGLFRPWVEAGWSFVGQRQYQELRLPGSLTSRLLELFASPMEFQHLLKILRKGISSGPYHLWRPGQYSPVYGCFFSSDVLVPWSIYPFRLLNAYCVLHTRAAAVNRTGLFMAFPFGTQTSRGDSKELYHFNFE